MFEVMAMIEAEFWDYEDAGELAEAVSGDVAFIIESALDARGEALIALPGISTATAPVYERLAKAKLNWKKVTIIPTDERVVPLTDPLSNVGTPSGWPWTSAPAHMASIAKPSTSARCQKAVTCSA